MSVSLAVGSVTTPGSTGTVEYPTVGFRPKAMMFWSGGVSGSAGAPVVGNRGFAGFAGDDLYENWSGVHDPDPSGIHTVNQQAVSWMGRDAQNPSQEAANSLSGGALHMMNHDGTATARFAAIVVNYTDSGFILNWYNIDGTSTTVFWLALGGADITGADVVGFRAPAATGVQSYTTSLEQVTPTRFQPETLLIAGSGDDTVSAKTGLAQHPLFGFARSTTERGTFCARSGDNVSPSTGQHRHNTAKVIDEIGQSNADFSAYTSTGFQLNWGAIGAQRNYFIALALKGGRWKGGAWTSPTVVGDKAVTGVGFAPKGVIVFGHGQTTATATTGNQNRNVLGAYAPSLQYPTGQVSRCTSGGQGGAADAQAKVNDARIWNLCSANAAVTEAATLSDIDSDGFTLNFTTVAAAAGNNFYLAVADNTALSGGGNIATGEAFGVGTIAAGFTGQGIPSEEAFGVGVITGPVTSGGGIASEEAFGVGEILGGLQPIPPTEPSRWRILYKALDGTVIGEVQDASVRRFSWVLNHPGTFGFHLAVQNPLMSEFLTRKDGLICIYQDNILRMVAEVTGLELARGDDDNKVIAVSGMETPWVRLPLRLIGKTLDGVKVETATDRGAFLSAQLDVLNAENETGIRISARDALSTITGGPWRYKPFMELWQELSASANGFDTKLVPSAAAPVTNNLELRSFLGTTKTDAIFEYGTGRHNLKGYRWTVDKTNMINRAFALPSDFPNPTLDVATAQDAARITATGLREAVISEDLLDFTLRSQLATEHVAIRNLPMERFFITPAENVKLQANVDYAVGDIVRGRIQDQNVIMLDALVRVYGVSVELNDEGQESTALTVVDE